jgi:hypothetical protein
MILRKNVNKKKPDINPAFSNQPNTQSNEQQLIRLSPLGRSEDLSLETDASYEAH